MAVASFDGKYTARDRGDDYRHHSMVNTQRETGVMTIGKYTARDRSDDYRHHSIANTQRETGVMTIGKYTARDRGDDYRQIHSERQG